MPDEIPLDMNINKEESEEPSFLELKAMERDAKRRRISYKNRNVYTKNKSNVEVLRDVIKNQMETYEEWLKSKNKSLFTTEDKSIDKNVQHSTSDAERFVKDIRNYYKIHTETKYSSTHSEEQQDTKSVENLNLKTKNIEEFSDKKKDYYNIHSYSKNEYDRKSRSPSYSRKNKKRSYSSSSEEEDRKEKYRKKHKKHSKDYYKRSDSKSDEEEYYNKYNKKKHKKEKKSKKRKHSRN